MRVLGGAGTGKTVVAMHRARWLAEKGLPEGRKVLFTTFTKESGRRYSGQPPVPCVGLRPWRASRWRIWTPGYGAYLRQRHYEYEILWGFDEGLWGLALALKPSDVAVPTSFYREEWQRVIQAQGIENLDDYKRATRVGRGTTLSRWRGSRCGWSSRNTS